MTYICHSGENRNPEGFPQLPSVALGPSVRRDDGTYNKTCHELSEFQQFNLTPQSPVRRLAMDSGKIHFYGYRAFHVCIP